MKNSVYDKHSKAFQQVAAYVIVKDGKQVGTIAYKFPKDGAGRLSCFLHFHGYNMVTGFAVGYGYDKKSAALESAASHKSLSVKDEYNGLSAIDEYPVIPELQNIGGSDAQAVLSKSGYSLYQAV